MHPQVAFHHPTSVHFHGKSFTKFPIPIPFRTLMQNHHLQIAQSSCFSSKSTTSPPSSILPSCSITRSRKLMEHFYGKFPETPGISAARPFSTRHISTPPPRWALSASLSRQLLGGPLRGNPQLLGSWSWQTSLVKVSGWLMMADVSA